jgi:transposase
MRTRRKYTDEFKREAVRLATAPGNSIAGISQDLGVDRSVVAVWVRKVEDGRYEAAPGKPLKSEEPVRARATAPRARSCEDEQTS